ncbi:acyltransferase [Shewanella polaris]|uniref:Acyltransferase n=1 Tax=Shewanella polaris TaxID=2588449 RepID=A0A4Y5YCZ9_9GAMM|nr:acyltransferase [Shewanella polaris]QDE30507.1 acyltransferase [Shewanella polaris]
MFFLLDYMRKIKIKMKRFYYTYRSLRGISEYRELPNVNNKSYFNNNTALGLNCNFNGMAISGGGKVTIGNNFHSGSECQIITQNHNINGGSIPYDNTYIIKDVEIGDNVWVGNRVIILGGVKIGEGAVIQAGSVVVSDIPALAIAGGHPAKVFSCRDSLHYEYHKKNKNFN